MNNVMTKFADSKHLVRKVIEYSTGFRAINRVKKDSENVHQNTKIKL